MPRQRTRLSNRSATDLRAIRRATSRIEELGVILDHQLRGEHRHTEQMQHLRQATGQITRAANDAIQAYRRVTQALSAEAVREDADPIEVAEATRELTEARTAMLRAIEMARQRYPWTLASEEA